MLRMRILTLLDPPQLLRPRSDTSVAIIAEALRRGHEVWICEPQRLWLRDGQAGASVVRVTAAQTEDAGAPALTLDPTPASHPLEHFHAVLMRKDPPYDVTYHLATQILEYGRGKTLLVNDPRGLREANEKLYIFHFPDLLAPTLVTDRIDELREFMTAQGGEMIVKPLDGFGGSSVFHVHKDDRNTSTILEVMTQGGRRWVMAQRYLDVARTGDKRILLLEGEPLAGFVRMPRGGELRSNMVVGGQAVAGELTDRDRQICARIKSRLIQDGLHFVGIDIIDGHLTEVNVTSPTGIQAANRLYDVRLEARFIDFLERRAPHSS